MKAATIPVFLWTTCYSPLSIHAGDLTVRLPYSENVMFVGAVNRWDDNGDARRPVDPKAKIAAPAVAASAQRVHENEWVFKDLAPGRYDLVILAEPRIRIEGFHYPPVLEFDPLMFHTAAAPEPSREQVAEDIAKSRHYENKVTPLYFAGDDKQIRVLVQLLRDKPTSYDGQFGEQVATFRHEVWQYTNRYGGWVKEKRTKVLDRILLPKRQLRRWTWIWQPELGGIEVAKEAAVVEFELPSEYTPKLVRGLLPY